MTKIIISLLPLLLLSLGISAQDKGKYFAPDYSVKFLSYFGIGSESVQKKSIIGFNATHYAKMQKQFPEWTGQGLGVPVYFYQQVIKSSGAEKLINNFAKLEQYTDQQCEEYCEKIQKAIQASQLPQNLVNQLNNAYEEFYKGKQVMVVASPNYYNFKQENGEPFQEYQLGSDQVSLEMVILEVYAQMWEENRVKLLGAKKVKQLAMGLLIREAYWYSFSHGTATVKASSPSTDNASKLGIFLSSMRNREEEIIYFPSLDSKWYRGNNEKTKNSVFVQNSRLTPIVRQIQEAVVKMNTLLKKDLTHSIEEEGKAKTSSMIIEVDYCILDGGKYPPKLRLLKANWYYK